MSKLIKNFGIIGNGAVPKSIYKLLRNGNYDVIRASDCIVLNCVKDDIERFAKWCKYDYYVWVNVTDSSLTVERWSIPAECKDFELEKTKTYPIEELCLEFPDLKCLQGSNELTDEQNSLLLKSIDPKRTGFSRYAARSRFNFTYYGRWNHVR